MTDSHRPTEKIQREYFLPLPLRALGGTPKVPKSTTRSGDYPANELLSHLETLTRTQNGTESLTKAVEEGRNAGEERFARRLVMIPQNVTIVYQNVVVVERERE